MTRREERSRGKGEGKERQEEERKSDEGKRKIKNEIKRKRKRKKRKHTLSGERKAAGRQTERGACWVFCADAAALVASGNRLAAFHL